MLGREDDLITALTKTLQFSCIATIRQDIVRENEALIPTKVSETYMKKERYNLTETLRGTLSINNKHEACFKTKTMWCPHSCDKSCGAHVK